MGRLLSDIVSKGSPLLKLKPVKRIRKKPAKKRAAKPRPQPLPLPLPQTRPKTRSKKKGAQRECFVCRLCRREIARDQDLLSRLELNMSFGLFRSVINVIGFIRPADAGRHNFIASVYCLQCNTNLGAFLLRVALPYLHGEHWVAGNYWMIMHRLLIRRGNSLLDAATRQVVGNI